MRFREKSVFFALVQVRHKKSAPNAVVCWGFQPDHSMLSSVALGFRKSLGVSVWNPQKPSQRMFKGFNHLLTRCFDV